MLRNVNDTENNSTLSSMSCQIKPLLDILFCSCVYFARLLRGVVKGVNQLFLQSRTAVIVPA